MESPLRLSPQLAGQTATTDLIRAVAMDLYPCEFTCKAFGIATMEHYQALYEPIRHGEITREQLERAAGDGPMLTELVNAASRNPHKGIDFAIASDNPTPENTQQKTRGRGR